MMALRLGLYLVLVLVFHFSSVAYSKETIRSLPGYPSDNLPFNLETGYVGVGKNKDVQLFYYFVESQRNAAEDPVLLWISGGPGCSSLRVFLIGIGPLTFDWWNYDYDGSLPPLILNPYTWTKNMSIIFLDAPVGTGFSYSETQEGYYTGDFSYAEHLYQFLQQFLTDHPNIAANEVYIAGDGQSGNPIPIAMEDILDGNEKGGQQFVYIKGYLLGNAGADFPTDFNARSTFANRLGLIPDDVYEAADELCNGSFIVPPNEPCEILVKYMDELVSNVDKIHALEPYCDNEANVPLKTGDSNLYPSILHLQHNLAKPPLKWCRKNTEEVISWWIKNEKVQDALRVAKAKKTEWVICNQTVEHFTYKTDVYSVVSYHQALARRSNLRGLIFSGDHDMYVPYIGTEKWIKSLGLSLSEIWRPLFVNGETAGYMRKYTNSTSNFTLTYATVKGGAHYPEMYMPRECAEMVHRWKENDTL